MEVLGDFKTFDLPQNVKDEVNIIVDKYAKQLTDSTDPIRERVGAIYNLLDEINEASFKGKQQPSCKKGCSHCCFIQVAATEWEVETILDYMKWKVIEFDDGDLEKLKKQALIKDDSEYMLSLDRRCVFLGADNMCQIYEARPAACRNYYVFNDPEDCNTFKGDLDGRTLVNFNLDTITPIMALMKVSNHDTLPRLLLKLLKLKSNEQG